MLSFQRIVSAILLLLVLVAAFPASAADPVKIRVGVLKFGTVNWHLKVIQEQGLAQAEGVELEVVPLANKGAINVALQGGAADIIVSDWIWVTRQRAEGRKYTFSPFSLAVGALMVRPDAGIATLADIKGKRLGVAGGPVDKSWLLIRAYGQKILGVDLADAVEPNFAAPPLLNQLMLKGDLPAVLNFWHFNARLKAAGMLPLVSVADILPELGVVGETPLLGYVFNEAWADENKEAVLGFLRAAHQARELMFESDEVWDELRPMMKAKDETVFIALRDGYRAGVPEHFGEAEIDAARQVFEIIARLGGEKLVGKSTTLDPGTFWDVYRF